MKSHLVALLAIGISSAGNAGCAAPGGKAGSSIAKNRWVVARTFCPVGCPEDVENFLAGFIGESVEISDVRFEAPFVDRCEGDVKVDLKSMSPQAIVDELNMGVAPRDDVSPASLGLSGDSVMSGTVVCRHGALSLPLVRLIAVERDRILVLFEQLSVVELR